MSPLTDAVCFVDGEQRNFYAVERTAKSLVEETFRCDVQHFGSTTADLIHCAAVFVPRQAGVQTHRCDAFGLQLVNLIFHQRDQRRNNNRQAVEHQRWQLVAKRFSTAGWKYGQDRVAV